MIAPVKDMSGNIIRYDTTIKGDVPIPNSFFTDLGIYAQDEFQLVPGKLNLTLGARADLIRVSNSEAVDPLYFIVNGVLNDKPANQKITFEQGLFTGGSGSGNASFQYSMG